MQVQQAGACCGVTVDEGLPTLTPHLTPAAAAAAVAEHWVLTTPKVVSFTDAAGAVRTSQWNPHFAHLRWLHLRLYKNQPQADEVGEFHTLITDHGLLAVILEVDSRDSSMQSMAAPT
jgi:hypothetical protein